jgi:hypothetical protein
VALARQAAQQFSAPVSVGVGAVATDPGDARTAGVAPVAVITPDAVSEMTLRLLGDGERARAHAASATVHVARLAVTGRDLPVSSFWARPAASGGR